MTKERRWLKSAIATARETQVALPWQRQGRQRPVAMKPVAQVAKNLAIAAR